MSYTYHYLHELYLSLSVLIWQSCSMHANVSEALGARHLPCERAGAKASLRKVRLRANVKDGTFARACRMPSTCHCMPLHGRSRAIHMPLNAVTCRNVPFACRYMGLYGVTCRYTWGLEPWRCHVRLLPSWLLGLKVWLGD